MWYFLERASQQCCTGFCTEALERVYGCTRAGLVRCGVVNQTIPKGWQGVVSTSHYLLDERKVISAKPYFRKFFSAIEHFGEDPKRKENAYGCAQERSGQEVMLKIGACQ